MKEKDIINFEELKKTNPELFDNDDGYNDCEICKTHEEAYKKLSVDTTSTIATPVCDKCMCSMIEEKDAIVSETNFSNPDGDIGYYSIFRCPKCNKLYAMMPIEIQYNGNHDIYYTGGKYYLVDDNMREVCNEIFETILPSVKQYIDRKLNPEDSHDINLDEWNYKTWIRYDIEHAIAKILYERGFKK